MRRIFITGTDTEVGKTTVSVAMLHLLASAGYQTIGIKPVASGCQITNGQLVNDDALALQRVATVKLSYRRVNPFAYLPAIAPDIAARVDGPALTLNKLIHECGVSLQTSADVAIIEGVGGWFVPLNNTETMADFVKAMDCAVIIVVGMRLGCLNHSLLTYQAICGRNIPILGWVANGLDPKMAARSENFHTLKSWLTIPCLGFIDYQQPAMEVLQLPHSLKIVAH